MNKSIQTKKKDGYHNFRTLITKFDIETKAFNFYLPDGNTRLRTVLGGITFIFFSTLFAVFIVNTMIGFSNRSYYNILELKENDPSLSNFDKTIGKP